MVSLLVAKKEFRRSLKNKKKLVLTFLLPLIAMISAIVINNMMKPSINMGIIENQYINKTAEEKINTVDGVNLSKANESTINTDLILAKYLGIIEFKEGGTLEVHSLDKNMKIYIEKAMVSLINHGNVDDLKALSNILDEGNLSTAQRATGFMFIMLIITSIMSATIMLRDKERRIILRYATTPNKISAYILGNYIYNLINTIVQILLASALLYLIKIDMGIAISQFLVIGLIISIVATSIALLVTVLSKNELQGSLMGSSIAIITALLGGAFLPIEKMPNMLKVISNTSVVKWIIELTSSIKEGIAYGNNLIIIMLIIIFSLITVFISIKIGEKRLRY